MLKRFFVLHDFFLDGLNSWDLAIGCIAPPVALICFSLLAISTVDVVEYVPLFNVLELAETEAIDEEISPLWNACGTFLLAKLEYATSLNCKLILSSLLLELCIPAKPILVRLAGVVETIVLSSVLEEASTLCLVNLASDLILVCLEIVVSLTVSKHFGWEGGWSESDLTAHRRLLRRLVLE